MDLTKTLTLAIDFDGTIVKDAYPKIGKPNPFAFETSEWFDPEWMFGIKDGFDIVIGNPPYAVSSTNKNDWIDKLISDYKKDLVEKRLKTIQSKKVKKGALPREEMPRIKPTQVHSVANLLNSGKVDIRKPFYKK